MRGEHNWFDRVHIRGQGSSPHARGALTYRRVHGLEVGIIPACAGSTYFRATPATSSTDHPRMRGEHSKVRQVKRLTKGSSPHARGALLREGHGGVVHGIIPACAGSTGRLCSCRFRRGDHPRMRGEHGSIAGSSSEAGGSSPHARGARVVHHHAPLRVGIIPACAGSTPVWGCGCTTGRDHPRMRGEHSDTAGRRRGAAGSSPHARGALTNINSINPTKGIIPACAGSTRR